MIHYFLLFFLPALMAFKQPVSRHKKQLFLWIFVGLLFTLFIGLRDNVGADWPNYLDMFERLSYGMTYFEALVHDDPAFWLLMVWMHDLDLGIYGVNLIGAVIFMTGLIIFLRRQPNPWLGLTIAVSYAIVVVTMGYVRQGIALGMLFWAISALGDRKFFRFIILVVLAATFHKSAVLMVGLGIFQQGKGKKIKILAVIFVAIGVYMAFLSGYEERFSNVYIEQQMQSSGAYIRIVMNLIPSLIFLRFRKEWKAQYNDYSFWYMIALGSIVSLFAVGFATTAVDRVALYFIPIQIAVFSRLPMLLQRRVPIKITTSLVVLYFGLIFFGWLNFATNAYAWLPYDNLILGYIFE